MKTKWIKILPDMLTLFSHKYLHQYVDIGNGEKTFRLFRFIKDAPVNHPIITSIIDNYDKISPYLIDKYNASLLYYACSYGHLNLVKYICNSPNFPYIILFLKHSITYRTPFEISIINNHINILEFIINFYDLTQYIQNYDIKYNIYENYYLEYHPNISIIPFTIDPLTMSITLNNLQMFTYLFNNNLYNNNHDNDMVYLSKICCMENYDIFLIYINKKNLNMDREEINSLLFESICNNNDTKIINHIITYFNISLDDVIYNSLNPLCVASLKGKDNTVRYLIDRGANINFLTDDRQTPLILSLKYKKFYISELLLLYKNVDVNISDSRLNTALTIAYNYCCNNDFNTSNNDILRLLIFYGANIDIDISNISIPCEHSLSVCFNKCKIYKKLVDIPIINYLSKVKKDYESYITHLCLDDNFPLNQDCIELICEYSSINYGDIKIN